MASWLHRGISQRYPVEVSSKSVHPSQSCDVKFDPLIPGPLSFHSNAM